VKNAKTLYWILTSLMAAFMLLASIPDVLRLPVHGELLSSIPCSSRARQAMPQMRFLGVAAELRLERSRTVRVFSGGSRTR
jgi:hypothetical protein